LVLASSDIEFSRGQKPEFQHCEVFENIISCKLNILFKTTDHVRVKLMGSQSNWVKLHQLGRNLGRFHAEKGLMRNTQDNIISV
jgi:hypothetical protein